MRLVAGIDSSTQSVKVVIRDAQTGELIREARGSHPDGTEVDPRHWWDALQKTLKDAGGLSDVEAISVGGQQHGLVALDSNGEVIRPALLWNDTRSAKQAEELNKEVGGNQKIADATGSVLLAAFTASKVRWVAENEPENAKKIAALALPHDWVSWKLQEKNDLNLLFTDRSEASGTGYFNPVTSQYDRSILAKALGSERDVILPRIVPGNEFGGQTPSGAKIGAGAGDNAAAAFGLQAKPGDVIVSLGTSGTAFSVSATPTHDGSGSVAGFADVSGIYLPLVCTLNAARILDAATHILNVSFDRLSELALSAPAGANGLSLLPYFEGERTPNRPDATGVMSGMKLENSNPECIARAMIEGMLCSLADAVDSLTQLGVDVNRILLIGGAAKNPAVGQIASALFGREVLVPPAGEYVANGAARQASWALLGDQPTWNLGEVSHIQSKPTPEVMDRYCELRDRTQGW